MGFDVFFTQQASGYCNIAQNSKLFICKNGIVITLENEEIAKVYNILRPPGAPKVECDCPHISQMDETGFEKEIDARLSNVT